jgi:23S rRNA (cytosine1962-C5)-methyltransferase
MERVEVRGEGLKKLRRGTGIVYRKWVKPLGNPGPGDVVEVVTERGDEVLACALWDPIGPVALRVMTIGGCPFKDVESLIEHKVEEALRVRERMGLRDTGSYRLINSDGDLFSGLIADVYNEEVVVLQSSSAAIDANLEVIARTISKEVGARNVYEKSTQRSRKDIGLEPRERWIVGRKERVLIDEQGVRFIVDVVRGQKTGFYLDQRMNRLELRRYVRSGDEVLDIFSYTGGFGLHAAFSGAKKVVFIEEDPDAVKLIKENAKLNNFESYEIINESVWSALEKVSREFDIIVVDPPAFIQSGDDESIRRGKKAYKRVYTSALRLAREGSIAFLSSCSYFLSKEDFISITSSSALDAGFSCYRLLGGLRGASPDHVLRGEEYLEYLKAGFFYLESC